MIIARREHARREEDGRSVLAVAVPVGALLRELPACGCGPADLVAAPSPEGSRPSGLGMPPVPESARARRSCPALAKFLRQLTLYLGGLAFPRPNPAKGRTAWRARRACP